MSTSHLVLRGLSKAYGETVAVAEANLDLERGAILALLGPSGCGKSTLLRLVAGFERPDTGTIELGGRTLAAPGQFLPPEKRKVGLVFQDYALFPHLSVQANIAFGVPRGVDTKARVKEMLELAGLSGLEKRMPHELSGGQQQRVALARTLAAEPDLVLLDEPFSNLDPTLRARVRNDVWQILRASGATAIVVTHDQEEAFSMPGIVSVMLAGRLMQTGPASELYLAPASRAVAEFLGDANFIRGHRQGSVVTCGLGTVPVVRPSADGVVDVMVRPEEIILDEASTVRGRVTTLDFYGHDLVAAMQLGDELVRIRVLRGTEIQPGQEYGVRVSGPVFAYPAAK